MGYLMDRGWLLERLRLNRSASYRLVRGTSTALINTDHVIELLNRSRRGPQPVITSVPSDLKTPEEIVASFPEFEKSGITTKRIIAWTHRKKNPPPFFLLSQQLRRFSLREFTAWLNKASTPRTKI